MSESTRDPMYDLVEEYVLDLLSASDAAAFEARMRVDRELAETVAATRDALSAAVLSTPVAPKPELKARVMAHAVPHAAEVEPPTEAKVLPFEAPRRPSTGLRNTVVALVVGLAASLILLVRAQSELSEQQQLSGQRGSALEQAKALLAQRESTIARLTDPAIELITLASTGEARPAVKVFVDQKRRTAVLSVATLEAAPSGKAYQLWFIVGGKSLASVTFQTDSTGHALLEGIALPDGDVVGTGITLEPSGGSETPTLPILFLGLAKR